MKRSYRVRIDAPIEAIYEYGFAPERWFRFYPGYRGLERVHDDWPTRTDGGPSLIPPRRLPITSRQVVVEHAYGRRLELYEEALPGPWGDRPPFAFESKRDATEVTLAIDPASKSSLARPVVFVVALGFSAATPRALRRLKAQIERSAR